MINLKESFAYPPYFIINHVRQPMALHASHSFPLFDFQETLVNHINVNRFSIVMTARRMGITNTLLANVLWHLNYRQNITIVLVGMNKGMSIQMFGRICSMYENLPTMIRSSLRTRNSTTLALANGSKVLYIDPRDTHVLTNSRADMVVFDGFSHTQNEVRLLSTALQCSHMSDGKIIISSSTNNFRSVFYDLWQDSVAGINQFKPIEFIWSDHPRLDAAWKQSIISLIGSTAFQAQYENHFI